MAALVAKRKRDSHDLPDMRAAPGMHPGAGHDFDQQYFSTEEIENPEHVGVDFSTMLGHSQADAEHEHAIEDDAQHAVGQQHQQPVQGAEGAGPSASDTAAAAMAQYHTMTVPQTTEQSFMQQAASAAAENPGGERQGSEPGSAQPQQQRTSSFGDFEMNPGKDGHGQSDQNGNGDTSPKTPSTSHGGPKPAVGSEEWHKVRRDNHKEGK
jgi:transcriptional regulator CBF1